MLTLAWRGRMAYKQNGQLIDIRRKVFISHYKDDKDEVEAFIDKFCDVEQVFIVQKF